MATALERQWGRPAMLACALGCLTMSGLRAGAGDPESPPPPVAVIESIQGKVQLTSAVPAGVKLLDPQRDVARLLHRGEILVCAQKSQVRLRLQSGSRLLKGPNRWPVPALALDEQGAVSLALQRLGSVGEALEPAGGPLLSPADGSSVRPDVATLRWRPSSKEIAFRLTNERGKDLWGRAEVPGAAGRLVDPRFNAALREFRESVSQGKLTLEARSDDAVIGKVEFSLISEQAEMSLVQELKNWSVEPERSLLRFVGRAAAFGRRSMWNEEADELEAAVAAFPKSATLLNADRAAQLRIGNLARAEELRRSLIPSK